VSSRASYGLKIGNTNSLKKRGGGTSLGMKKNLPIEATSKGSGLRGRDTEGLAGKKVLLHRKTSSNGQGSGSRS